MLPQKTEKDITDYQDDMDEDFEIKSNDFKGENMVYSPASATPRKPQYSNKKQFQEFEDMSERELPHSSIKFKNLNSSKYHNSKTPMMFLQQKKLSLMELN